MSSEYANPNEDTRKIPRVLDLLRVALFLGLLAVAASALNLNSWRAGGVTILWPSNGFLLGVLLCSPRRHWLSYLTLGYLVDLCVNIYLNQVIGGTHPNGVSVYLAFCNMLEVFLAAQLLYKTISPHPDLTERRQLIHLLAYGVVLAPGIASFLASFGFGATFTLPDPHSFQEWFTADGLGVAIVTPLYLSYRQREHFPDRSWREIAGLFLILCTVTFYVFWQIHYPILFLVVPFLLVMGMRLRLAGSALGLLIVCIIGGFLTTAGHGPVALVPGISLSGRALVLQFFVAVSMLVLYIIEVLKAESSRLQSNLQRSENRFRLLAEVSHDIIVLTDLTARRRYVSPASAEILGWEPEELIGGNFHQIVHPDDIAALEQLFKDCRSGRPYNILSYRCRKKDGSWLWVEANLRLYRDSITSEPVGFVNVVRDIATRKAAEDELTRAVHLAELLASVDGLTGIANRRRLDEIMDQEWRRAIRDRTSISLLIIDVDNFKSYNDLYGHLKGDECLRRIAATAGALVKRSTDLLARFGGEEFVVVMPGTGNHEARAIAEQIRLAVAELCLPHQGNTHGCITVSIGCATQTPAPDTTCDLLVAAADQALYRAKEAGRNCVECTDAVPA